MTDQLQDKPILTPGPDHPITIEPNSSRVLVRAAGKVIADTRRALTLREADYQPVEYIPLEDVDRSLLIATEHSSYCPFKGDCNYYSITGADSENAVWEYREPFAAVAVIKDHVAFYPDRVEQIEQRPE